MEVNNHKIELTSNEINVLTEILNYSMEYCPIESISSDIEINHDLIQSIIFKLKNI
jgi:hypothetical protein